MKNKAIISIFLLIALGFLIDAIWTPENSGYFISALSLLFAGSLFLIFKSERKI